MKDWGVKRRTSDSKLKRGGASPSILLRGSQEKQKAENIMGNTMQKSQQTEVEEPGQLQREEDSNFTCEICIEPMLAIRKFKNGSLCKHPFCLDCIGKYIEVKVEETAGYIECPGLNCKQSLDPLSCSCIISKPIFEKWCDRLCDSTVLGSERCYCPYQDCSVLVLNECGDKLKKMKCPRCKKNFCFLCKIPWHAGYECNETRHLRDSNDILVGELIEEKRWTRCYNCGHSVERVSGCRDIKCKCGVRFCHNCGGPFHFGPCKHKRCGDVFCNLFIFVVLSALCYFVYFEIQSRTRKG